MKIKSKTGLTEAQIKKIFQEELVLTIKEDLDAGRLNEDFLKHLKSAGKGMFDYYKILMTNYAKTLDDMVNQELIPSALGDQISDAADDLAQPEAFQGADPAQQADAVGDLEDLMQTTADAAEDAGADGAADKVQDMADAAGAVEQAAEKEGAGAAEGGGEPKVQAAVLDLIDATNEKWDQIMAATGDDNLKKSMEYMEKVALSEKLFKEIRRLMLENEKKNQGNRLINNSKIGG